MRSKYNVHLILRQVLAMLKFILKKKTQQQLFFYSIFLIEIRVHSYSNHASNKFMLTAKSLFNLSNPDFVHVL